MAFKFTEKELNEIKTRKWNAVKLGAALEVLDDGHKTSNEMKVEETVKAVKFLTAFKVFRLPEYTCPKCSSGEINIHVDHSKKEHIQFGCSKRSGYSRSAFKVHIELRKAVIKICINGTWFENVHMPLKKTIYLSYYWAKGRTVTEIQDELEVGSHTAVDHYSFCRELCEGILLKFSSQIGGPGCTVEIDESCFRKRKHHRGARKRGQQWVFGGVCRETKECFMVEVADRSAKTLIPLIKLYIAPGTKIIADCWKAYSTLKKDQDFTFFTINHSIHFVDDFDKSIHTNEVEGMWRLVKRAGPMTGTTRDMSESYLSEFMWRRRNFGQDLFTQLLQDIGETYRGVEELNDMDEIDPAEVTNLMKSCYEVPVDWKEALTESTYELVQKLAAGLTVGIDILTTALIFLMPCVMNGKTKIRLSAWK